MGLDEELESMEEPGETDAEWIDQETELQDVEGDEDEIFGADAAESDVEHAYDSFMTDNEADYDGWDEGDVDEALAAEEEADVLDLASCPEAWPQQQCSPSDCRGGGRRSELRGLPYRRGARRGERDHRDGDRGR